jgi:hypothetical protein
VQWPDVDRLSRVLVSFLLLPRLASPHSVGDIICVPQHNNAEIMRDAWGSPLVGPAVAAVPYDIEVRQLIALAAPLPCLPTPKGDDKLLVALQINEAPADSPELCSSFECPAKRFVCSLVQTQKILSGAAAQNDAKKQAVSGILEGLKAPQIGCIHSLAQHCFCHLVAETAGSRD